jgi:hypothetical protein
MIKVTFWEDDCFIKNIITIRVERYMSKQEYDDLNNTGAIRPDKKDCIQEASTEKRKEMRKLSAKDVQSEGSRERKNIIIDERTEC